MTRTRVSVLAGVGIVVGIFSACSLGQGGAPGPIGSPGPAGAAPPSSQTAGSCTIPCHAFENSLVDQWRDSKHHHAAELLEEVGAMMLSYDQMCGNCHATDGVENRLAGNVATKGDAGTVNVQLGHVNVATDGGVDRILYRGTATTTLVHCTTCHAYTKDNDPHLTGRFKQVPLRVPFGEERICIEKSPPASGVTGTILPTSYGPGNTCMFCHKSLADVTYYIKTTGPTAITPHWGPHNGPQADLFTGLGGYRWPGKTYDTSLHSELPNGCTRCHMTPTVENNNLPDHSFRPRLSGCTASNCHGADIRSFDVAYPPHDPKTQGGRTVVVNLLAELRSLLCPRPASDAGADADADADGGAPPTTTKVPCLLSRGETAPAPPLSGKDFDATDLENDFALAASPPLLVPADVAGALFNYLLEVKSRCHGVHNPIYEQQLLWDSIFALKGGPPAAMPARPTPLPAAQ